MASELFFKDPALPFAEFRRSRESERRYRPHMHRDFCVGAVDRGEVAYQVLGAERILRPGSLALIAPETLHACNPSGPGRRSYSVLYLDAAWCRSLLPSAGAECGLDVRPLLEDREAYDRFMDAMGSLIAGGPSAGKERILSELARTLLSRAGALAGARERPPPSSPKIARMRSALGSNLDSPLPAEGLARELGASRYSLLREFKASTGMTPHAYRTYCRIELARELLREGEEPSRVALDCGFFDQSHMHRHFKAMTAVTPREYQVNFVQ